MSDFLKNLQSKPYETRIRILWSAVTVAAVVLIVLFVFNIRQAVKNTDGNLILPAGSDNTNPATNLTLVSLESAEQDVAVLKIYFNVNNPTDDILVFSPTDKIYLRVNGQKLPALAVTNRQGGAFVQKVLSRTQNFGILVFSPTEALGGELVLDEMVFEKDPTNIFKASLEANLEQLKQNDNQLRN